MSIYGLRYELFETAGIEDSKLVCNVLIAAVVAFSDNAVDTLVVPLIKLPETVKLAAVAVPFHAGAAIGALKFSADCVKLETILFASAVLANLTIAFCDSTNRAHECRAGERCLSS